jgi:ribosomal protein S18 acetylase RimI-like enzyme
MQADTEAVIALWRVVFPEYNDPARPQRDPRANIARKLAVQPELFWVAEQQSRIVGTAMAGYDGHRGWIYALGVDPTARRSGIGSLLLREAEDALRALDCPKINLQVMEASEVARRFYEAAGYAVDRVISYGKRT